MLGKALQTFFFQECRKESIKRAGLGCTGFLVLYAFSFLLNKRLMLTLDESELNNYNTTNSNS